MTTAVLREPDGRLVEPQLLVYPALGGSEQPRADIQSSATEDLYVVLDGATSHGGAAITIYVNPLVTWIWIGGAILILGVIVNNLGRLQGAGEVALTPAAEETSTRRRPQAPAAASPAAASARPAPRASP